MNISRKQMYTKEQYNKKLLKQRQTYAVDPSKTLLRSRKHNLKKYGLTLEDYVKLVDKQGNKCAICGGIDSKALNVDHNHVTMKIRGLLCTKCNTALGLFNDNKDILQKAIAYLGGIA